MTTIDINEIISRAKAKYPISVHCVGKFSSEEDILKLEKYCDIHCSYARMDGNNVYNIRYRGENNETN